LQRVVDQPLLDWPNHSLKVRLKAVEIKRSGLAKTQLISAVKAVGKQLRGLKSIWTVL